MMLLKMIGRGVLYLLKSVALLLLLIFLFVSIFYVATPIYDFREPTPFSGDSIRNPYEGISDSLWLKGNFHAHSSNWGGLTNGSSSVEDVLKAYKDLRYDIYPLSNYESHTDYRGKGEAQIPLYEQGWAYSKFHFLVFGGHPVVWENFAYYTLLSQKQYLINLLSRKSELICLNHLAHVRGMELTQMRYLTGAPLMEAVSGMANSLHFWDEALSHGNLIWGIANDDSHGAKDYWQIGRFATILQSPSKSEKDIVAALKNGACYALHYPDSVSESIEKKRQAHYRSYPRLLKADREGDSISVRFDQTATEIRLVGDRGEVVKQFTQCNGFGYRFTSENSYIRVEALFASGITLYMNPFTRYNASLDCEPAHKVNIWLTLIHTVIWFGVFCFISWLCYQLIRRFKIKRK